MFVDKEYDNLSGMCVSVGMRAFSFPELLLIFVFFLASFSVKAYDVIELKPKPNYSLTSDAHDAEQLNDGEKMKYPIWLHKKTVGWNAKSPVKIHLKLNKSELTEYHNKSYLKIHTAVGKYAGVQNISRVDVFSSDKLNSNYSYVGLYMIDKKHKRYNKQSYSVDIALTGLRKFVSIIIHVDKGGIFVDEVEFSKCFRAFCDGLISKEGDEGKNNIQDEVLFSKKLLKNNIKKTQLDRRIEKIRLSKSGNIEYRIWHTPCYKELDWFPGKKELSKNKIINLNGYTDEAIDFCIGIANMSDKQITLNWKLSEYIEENSDVYKISESILRTGKYVYDYMVLQSEHSIKISPFSTNYLLYKIHLNDLLEEDSFHTVDILNVSLREMKNFNFHIKNTRCKKITPPMDLNVWSYSVNRSIWKNKIDTVSYLYKNHVRYFTVHSGVVSSINGNSWNVKSIKSFLKELQLYKNKGTILIVPGWHFKKLKFLNGKMPDANTRMIKEWVTRLSALMVDNGFDFNEWALYVVDEPHGNKLKFLKYILPHIKSANSHVQIYANPSYSRRKYASIEDLEYLDKYINLWQPSWAYYTKVAKNFFDTQVDKKWMIYRNPKYPAKAANPEFDYRYMAWRANVIGASGFGVWSFDDTQRGSAVDDFDGIRSDWSMMYESEEYLNSPSRRWMALMKGVDDMRLISGYLSGEDRQNLYNMLFNANDGSDLDSNLIENYRTKALSACQYPNG